MRRITTALNDLSKANRNRHTLPTKSFLNLVDMFRDVNYDERVDFADFVSLVSEFRYGRPSSVVAGILSAEMKRAMQLLGF